MTNLSDRRTILKFLPQSYGLQELEEQCKNARFVLGVIIS